MKFSGWSVEEPGENLNETRMITDPASAIKQEVLQLIDLQIETLKQKSSLDSSQLKDYQARSERIRKLHGELDRIEPTQLLPRPR
jgi:hypothetical protein